MSHLRGSGLKRIVRAFQQEVQENRITNNSGEIMRPKHGQENKRFIFLSLPYQIGK